MFHVDSKILSLFQGLDALLQVYSELDRQIETFKNSTGLDCIKHCRECCSTSSQNIEVSILEILPLSIHLWQSGKAEGYLEKLYDTSPHAPCVLFNPDISLQPHSGCSAYMWRPLICRLFGFSAMLDKQGKPSFILCKHLKRLHQNVEVHLEQLTGKGLQVPISSITAQKISLLNPSLGQKRFPINEALRAALEMVGYRLSLAGGAEDDHSGNTPPPPSRNPRFKKPA